MIGNFVAAPSSLSVSEERIAIVLGLLAVTTASLTFLSCRSCLKILSRLGIRSPLDNQAYASFYRFHSYYWWAFWFVIVLHLMTGVMHTGLVNRSTDPDAYLHWYSLWSGLAGFVAFGIVIMGSCRSFVNLADFLTEKRMLESRPYSQFYRQHAFYWFFFALVVVAHFTIGFIHSGIWPS